jgi:hypothetical protein
MLTTSGRTVKLREFASCVHSVRSATVIDRVVACSCCVAELIESGEGRRRAEDASDFLIVS